MKIRIIISGLLLAMLLTVPALGQGENENAVWNVYCTGDRSQCTVAKEPAGEFMFNVFPGKVTWDDAQAWMTSNGNIESTPDLNVNGNWNMGGPYNIGMPCQIIQQGSALTIINENGARSTGSVLDGVTVIATDWEGGLKGTISADGNRIDWANGTWWVRQIQ